MENEELQKIMVYKYRKLDAELPFFWLYGFQYVPLIDEDNFIDDHSMDSLDALAEQLVSSVADITSNAKIQAASPELVFKRGFKGQYGCFSEDELFELGKSILKYVTLRAPISRV